MNIFETPLGGDVAAIIKRSENASPAINVRMEWAIPEKEVIPIRRLHSVSTLRDYREGTFDLITAMLEVDMETYQGVIYPNRALLLIDVYKTRASERGVYSNNPTLKTTYKVLLLTNEDHELFDQTYSGDNSKDKSSNIMNIDVQLIPYDIYLYKNVEYSSVLGKGNLEDYLYYFMSHRGKMQCSIHPVDNVDDTENILIPEGIDLLNLANWIQRDGPGIYNHGINTYYQLGMMFVYPIALLTTNGYRRKIAIFRSGSDVGVGTGNTYAIIDGVLNFISSGDSPIPEGEDRLIDLREALEQEHGNAVRWNDPRYQSSIIDDSTDTMRYTSRGSKVYGLPDVDIKVQKIHRNQTVNDYSQRSIINKTVGRIFTIPWHSGDIDLIEPGTEVTYYYMKGKKMEYVTGIVEGTMEQLTPRESNSLTGIMNIESHVRLRVI